MMRSSPDMFAPPTIVQWNNCHKTRNARKNILPPVCSAHSDAIYAMIADKNDILEQNSCFCSEASLIWLPRPFQLEQIILPVRSKIHN